MKFTKMHGAGNDFIIINNIIEGIPQPVLGHLAKQICQRRISVGADGFMAVCPAEKGGDYKMLFFNSDGSVGEMCGNGARCIARYGYEKGLAGEVQHIETTAGMVIGERITKREYRVRLNDVTKMDLKADVKVDGVTYECAYVELGDPAIPHAAVRIKGLSHDMADQLREIGRTIRFNPAFPKGANVNFYDIIDDHHLVELTFERGVEDFTLACGTGTGSVVAAVTEMGLSDGNGVKVSVPGGTLTIDYNGSELYLTGPTNVVCEGELTDEDIDFFKKLIKFQI